jgi:hypothetical protein
MPDNERDRPSSAAREATGGTMDEDTDVESCDDYSKCLALERSPFEPNSAPHSPQISHEERNENTSDELNDDDEEGASAEQVFESAEELDADAGDDAEAYEDHTYAQAAVGGLPDDRDAASVALSEADTNAAVRVNDATVSLAATEVGDVMDSASDVSESAHGDLFDDESYAAADLNLNLNLIDGSTTLPNGDSFATPDDNYCHVAFSSIV